MNYKTLSNGFSLPDIGLGTGGDQSKVSSNIEIWKQSIKDAIEIGYVHIDCAAMYSNGKAEEVLGDVIKQFDRSKLIISTKVSPQNLTYSDFISSVKESLKKLQIDYVDLLYIHAPNPDISLEETMRAMNDCIDEGLVKHPAVSNFNLSLLKRAQTLSKYPIVANQIEYNLATREISHCEGCDHQESEIVPYCQENNILVVAYRPVDRGSILKPNELLTTLSKKYNKTVAQIALNWLISQKNIVVIPRSDSREHLKENYNASGWCMTDDDIERLRTSYPLRDIIPYSYLP